MRQPHGTPYYRALGGLTAGRWRRVRGGRRQPKSIFENTRAEFVKGRGCQPLIIGLTPYHGTDGNLRQKVKEMHDMTIGRAARKAGVGVETIRFYERKGLIEKPPTPVMSGFRSYPEQTVEQIRFIRQAKELGFSLREVRELLDLRADPQADAADVRARATAKLGDVKEKMRQLRRIENALERLISACPGQGALGCCSIMEGLERPDAAGDDHATAGTTKIKRWRP